MSELFRGIIFDRIYFMLENYDSFRGFYMCFRDSQDINYNRFWARLVLRLDIKLWTKIINQSGLLDVQGRSIPLECFFWTHNDKTISSDKMVVKNIQEVFYVLL
jgi:hypothetical protein